MTGRTRAPKTTKLADDTLDAPQSTSAGDAPADTYDATERVSSSAPDKATAAGAGHQTVNTVEKVGDTPAAPTSDGSRTETYTAFKADGSEVTVTRDLVTGETTIDADPVGG